MLVIISDFAKERNMDRDTVNAFIRKHPEIQKECSKQGKNIAIDTESKAYQLLDKQYPLMQPIQIVEDTESRKQLIQAQQTIIQLQNSLIEAHKQIGEANSKVLLLEVKEEQLEDLQESLNEVKNEKEELQKEIEAFEKENERLKSRSLLDRILNR